MWRQSPSPADGIMLSRYGWNFNVATLLAIYATVGIFLLTNISGSPEELTSRFSVDDTFYYLQIAWQSAQSGFVTFDGVHSANGVHFLWFAVLFLIAVVSPDKGYLLHGAYYAAFVLVCLVYALTWRTGTLLADRSRHLTLMFALLWTIGLVGQSHQLFVGMESTLQMVALWACFSAYLDVVRKLDAGEDIPERSLLILAGCLVALTWARIDSAIYSALIFASILHHAIGHYGIKAFISSKALWLCLAAAAAGATVQAGFYILSGDTVLPISGLIKSASPHALPADALRSFVSMLFPFGPVAAVHTIWFLGIGAAGFGSLLIYVVRNAYTAASPLRHAFRFATLLGIGSVIYAAASCAHHDSFSRWYLAPVYMFYIVGVGCFLHRCLHANEEGASARFNLRAIVGLTIYLLCLVGMMKGYTRVPLYLARYQLSQILQEETAPGAILASFNAGQLAFFANRRLINLDGLVNDKRYFEEILNDPARIVAYLRQNGVTHVVDYDLYWAHTEITRSSEPVLRFPANDAEGHVFTVRRMKYD